MKITTQSILILFGILAFSIAACIPITFIAMPFLQPSQAQPIDAAATMRAILTQSASNATQFAPPTPIPATPVPATTVPPTRTAVPTAVSYCDWVRFVKDVSVPDGTSFAAGEVFTKTWRLQNRGTCTWTPDYSLVYASGDPMGSSMVVALPGYVAPGETVDVSVMLTATNSTGKHTGYWMLRNQYGTLFGGGNEAEEAFFVEIITRPDSYDATLTGNLSYPSEFIPAMRVAAFSLTNGNVYFTDTAKGQGVYSLNVPGGTYYVVAYPYEGTPGNIGQAASWSMGGGTFSGGYTKAVQCGLTAQCLDHALVAVVAFPGQALAVDPGDWYALEGSFPRMPGR